MELIDDPITRAVMERDGVSVEDLHRAIGLAPDRLHYADGLTAT